jgi:hypothetical protein
MSDAVEIQDIERLRLSQGIDDVELRDEVGRLRPGDLVRLTFLCGPRHSETIAVRITSIRGDVYRGKLTAGPSSAVLPGLHVGQLVVFSRTHIHSVVRRQANKPVAAGAAKPGRNGR